MSDVNPGPNIAADPNELSPGKKLLLELGPLALYFLVFSFWPGPELIKLVIATVVFLVAMIISMAITYAAVRKVTTLQWLSVVMIAVSVGITLLTRDERYIKMKPTLFYLLASGLLGWGLLRGKTLLKMLLGTAYPGLSNEGWVKLTKNWTVFFFVLAIINELVWRNSSTSFWLSFKIWGMIPLTFIFAAANVPMLMRHGLNIDPEAKKAE